MSRLNGLLAAPFTPIGADGEVNLKLIEKQVEHLLATGVVGAFVCGTTGEVYSLTVEERMAVAQRWVEVGKGRLGVYIHVGDGSIRTAAMLAQHARKIGADGIAAMAPTYYKPANVDQLVACCRQIASAAGDLAFYYYHIPFMSGIRLPMVEFLQKAADIPTLRGMKFSDNDLIEFLRCMSFGGGRFEVSCGLDEMWLATLANGAESAIGSSYNYAAKISRKVMLSYRAGDLAGAREAARHVAEMMALVWRYGGIRAAKTMMAMQGLDLGPPRLPIGALTAEESRLLRRDLEGIGFFDWAA